MAKTKSPAVQPDHEKQTATVRSEPGTVHTERLRRTGRIGRADILRKYWELANLDPEVTKGTITGQLKALDSLCEELALDESGDGEVSSQQKQQIYRSAWLREAENSDRAQKSERITIARPAQRADASPRKEPVARGRVKAGNSIGRAIRDSRD